MLSCGKVIGQFSKITRHAYANNVYQPLKYVGIVSISNLRYSSDTKNKRPSGTTLKAEECVPGSQFASAQKPPPFPGPPCEAKSDGSCPASCYEDCGVKNSQYENSSKGGGPNNPFKYWKQILFALFITGATIYTVKELKWFDIDEKVQQPTGNKKHEKSKKRVRRTIKLPPVSSHIPNEIPYLLIGGGTAAFSAFRSIKSRDPKAKVLVVSEENDLPYMRPPLSKELWYNSDREASAQLNFKQWNGTQRSLYYEPVEFYTDVTSLTKSEKGGVAVARGWKVKKIDVVNKTAILEDDYEIKYDKCLIATGASPTTIPVLETAEDAVKKKMVPLRTTQDFLELEENVNDPSVKNIVIVGGGFLGSELACSLARNLNLEKKKIFQIYKEKSIMAQVLPEYLSEWTTRKTIMEGVNSIPNAEIQDYNFKDGKLSLILTNGQAVDADQVVVAVGVQANTQLAETSNLEVDPKIGGFLVNAELEARSNLWVAGDAACFYDVRLGRRRVEHHDHAVISGRLAGENMTGAGKPYLHQSMFWSDLGPDVGYEAIGIVDSSLPTVGVFVKATEEDTPLAAVTASNESIRSESEENPPAAKSKVLIETELVAEKTSEPPELSAEENSQDQKTNEKSCPESTGSSGPAQRDEFGKGVIFYLRDDVVVGIVLWNIFNRMSIARQVLARDTQYDDLNEVAKLFTIHED